MNRSQLPRGLVPTTERWEVYPLIAPVFSLHSRAWVLGRVGGFVRQQARLGVQHALVVFRVY